MKYSIVILQRDEETKEMEEILSVVISRDDRMGLQEVIDAVKKLQNK